MVLQKSIALGHATKYHVSYFFHCQGKEPTTKLALPTQTKLTKERKTFLFAADNEIIQHFKPRLQLLFKFNG